ncbi:acylneuraminate cytidylyltransferase family protein [Diaminobutyricimonas sp. TR449]|uniref:acylneuraminate cytidylyltransferase family protein n=1 Tax=Diaminobutyricimonas sp. TR449 TaxID=2708076 RepID=UPI001FBBCB92|nr:acylneuraminate cytidylyltransferase family protein [Diaminobutyricimonas sp. TR449]
MNGRVVAVIPARGGSKGVPRKNLRLVGGRPLIARAVDAALASERVDTVYVSTDDVEIAEVARAAGAEVIDRPAELARDESSSEDALLHALEVLESAPVVLVFIQPTSPFIDPAAIDAAIDRVAAGEDVVFSAAPTHAFLWREGADGAEAVNHEASVRPRRQDRDPQFQETGAFYVMRADGFRKARFRFFGRIGMAVVDEADALEIDTVEQLRLADHLATLAQPTLAERRNP